MKLASHNSMTYLPIKKWWLKPFRFIAQCQNKTIEEQYQAGVRMFDIRIAFNKQTPNPEFKHGLMSYKGNVLNTLNEINSFQEPIYVRLILETHKKDSYSEDMFITYCNLFEKQYTNIKFFCGVRKYDWKELYHFNTILPSIKEIYASYQLPKIDDLWPWLYAKLHNRKIKDIEEDFLMIDYV